MDYYTATILLSLERLTYGFIWAHPKVVSKFCNFIGRKHQEPETINTWVASFKLVQLYVFGTWYYERYGASLPMITIGQAVLALLVFLCGQMLNILVWYRIGVVGVCYGCKFERNVPWCVDFPYSVLSHPQYIGAILTVWGLFMLCWTENSDWYMIPLIETGMYMSSMYYLEA